MLDVLLRDLSFRYGRGALAIRDVSLAIPGGTNLAVVGPPNCGGSTLLRLIAGTLRPSSGEIILGQRRVTAVKAEGRPLLSVTAAIEVPGRWSVQHALVAAVRRRSLDRVDRHREYQLVVEGWELAPLLDRRIDSLSATEQTRVHLARIELLRPAILVADRLFAATSPASRLRLADAFHRAMRVAGTTIIATPSSHDELAFSSMVAVLEDGFLVQQGRVSEVFAEPVTEGAALATGAVDVIPVSIQGTTVESVIGSWELAAAPFQGTGVALVRPADFAPVRAGEDSDFVFGIEEAGFAGGRWLAHGVLTGGVRLRVELPGDTPMHKGRLLALRYDPARFRLLPRATTPLQPTIPTDVVPLLRDSR